MTDNLPAVRHSISEIEAMAKAVSDSRLFGLDKAQAMTLMLLAEAEGLHPIKAMMRFHVVQGRPAMKADAMLAEFQSHGGTVEWVRTDAESCEAVFTHPVQAPKGQPVSFTMADAKRAGLGGKGPWQQYPANMLRARVISNGIRMILPGVVSGIYTPEEVADFDPPQSPLRQIEARTIQPQPAAASGGESNGHERTETWASYVARTAQTVNDSWLAELAYEGVDKEKRQPLINQYQVTNAICTKAIAAGLIEESLISRVTDGGEVKRDRQSAMKAVADLFGARPVKVKNSVEAYVLEKLRAARLALGIPDRDAPEPEDAVPLPAGRMPGEDEPEPDREAT